MFFMNMQAIETIFNDKVFLTDSIKGNWIVENDDLYTSQSKYRNFFYYEDASYLEHTVSSVVFKIKNYDLVGPADFHEDDKLDPLMDNKGMPWLSVDIKFLALNNDDS